MPDRQPPTTSTDLTPLPGEEAVATALLDRAVADINRIHAQKGMELVRALGTYLLNTFFEGRLEVFRNRQGRHQTFRALARREDLHVSYATLWYSIAILEQLEHLPERLAQQLSFSHHRLLLPIKDPREKRALAQRAVDDNLTSRQLEALVRSKTQRARVPRTGRPRTPAVVKGIKRVRAAVEIATSEEIDPSAFRRMSREDVEELLEDLRRQLDTLATLADTLEARVLQQGDAS